MANITWHIHPSLVGGGGTHSFVAVASQDRNAKGSDLHEAICEAGVEDTYGPDWWMAAESFAKAKGVRPSVWWEMSRKPPQEVETILEALEYEVISSGGSSSSSSGV